MKINKSIVALLGLSGLALSSCKTEMKQAFQYPETEKRDSSDSYFGTTVPDPYRWLEDDYAPEVVEWVKAQNQFATQYLDQLPEKAAIHQRLKEIWNYERLSTPFRHHGNTYYFKNDGVQNQSVMYQSVEGGEDRVILDPNTFSEDGTVALSGMAFSKDGRYLAYGQSASGSDWKSIVVKDMESGAMLSDKVDWVKFSGISWEGNGFYYSRYGIPKEGDEFSQKNEYHKVFYHTLGTDQQADKLIWEDKEHPQRNFYAGTTEDEDLLILGGSEGTSGNALWVKPKGEKLMQLVSAFDNDFNVVGFEQGKVHVLTNYKAPNQRLIAIDLKNPAEENWKELIAEREQVIEGITRAGSNYLVKYLKDVASYVEIVDVKTGKFIREMELPGLGSVGGINGEKESNDVYFSFSNYITPGTNYHYNLKTGKTTVYNSPEIDFDPTKYETKRVFYTSKDGTKIPMFITHKKGLKMDGTNPTFLYGYGGFDISITPSFSIARAILLEKGAVYAVANLRGGGEYGANWHEAGTKMQKQNVFDDFIAAAEYLIAENYTSPKKLAVHGRSNGGLLIGAVMTQRPDLFAVALPGVGVLDMLRYHKFTIGWAWAGDYGRSDDSKEMFHYLYNYSPVHNVKSIDYPATMVITGDHDDRVVPAHSFKFAAELQAKNSSEFPMLLRVDINAGHGAGKPTSKQIEEWADIYAFMFHHLKD